MIAYKRFLILASCAVMAASAADQVYIDGVSQSINTPAQVQAIAATAASGKLDRLGGTATNVTVRGFLTLNGTNVLSGVTAFTNGIVMADGVLNGTNGVFFVQPGSEDRFWLLLPPITP